MRLWLTPTIWSHPSSIEGIMVTEYWDYGHPELLPNDARSKTYKNKRTDPDDPVSIPKRKQVKTPAVLDAQGKVVTPAVYVVDKPLKKDEDGKVIQPETHKTEVVTFTEYAELKRLRAIEDAKLPKPKKL